MHRVILLASFLVSNRSTLADLLCNDYVISFLVFIPVPLCIIESRQPVCQDLCLVYRV